MVFTALEDGEYVEDEDKEEEEEEEEEEDETDEWCECCACGKEITDDTNTKIVCGKDIGCGDESECVVCLECYEDKEEE
jgi:hypothetical protein